MSTHIPKPSNEELASGKERETTENAPARTQTFWGRVLAGYSPTHNGLSLIGDLLDVSPYALKCAMVIVSLFVGLISALWRWPSTAQASGNDCWTAVAIGPYEPKQPHRESVLRKTLVVVSRSAKKITLFIGGSGAAKRSCCQAHHKQNPDHRCFCCQPEERELDLQNQHEIETLIQHWKKKPICKPECALKASSVPYALSMVISKIEKKGLRPKVLSLFTPQTRVMKPTEEETSAVKRLEGFAVITEDPYTEDTLHKHSAFANVKVFDEQNKQQAVTGLRLAPAVNPFAWLSSALANLMCPALFILAAYLVGKRLPR